MSEDNLNKDIVEDLVIDEETKTEEVKGLEDLIADLEVSIPKPVLAEESVDNKVISSEDTPKSSKSKKTTLSEVDNGVIGSSWADRKDVVTPNTKFNDKKEETVAIFSTRNVTWPNVGKVSTGYNIVKASEAEKWLTRSHVRLATPEEVAKEYNN